MKNLNNEVKMKVLSHLRKHMDDRMSSRLKPKQEVKEEHLSLDPLKGEEQHESKLPLPLDPSHEQPKEHGLDDDDTHRLMQLYSSLK